MWLVRGAESVGKVKKKGGGKGGRMSDEREKRNVLVGKGIISSHSGVRYVSVLGFKIPSSKTLLPACESALSFTAQRIFSIRPGAMKLAYPS